MVTGKIIDSNKHDTKPSKSGPLLHFATSGSVGFNATIRLNIPQVLS
jgi:hypothetical protein